MKTLLLSVCLLLGTGHWALGHDLAYRHRHVVYYANDFYGYGNNYNLWRQGYIDAKINFPYTPKTKQPVRGTFKDPVRRR